MTLEDAEGLRNALSNALEAADRSGRQAGLEAFYQTLVSCAVPRSVASPAERYEPGTWKRDVAELAQRLSEENGGRPFRFRDFARFEAELKEKHDTLDDTMTGVNVTLRGLVRDGVLEQPQRGHYRLSRHARHRS